MQCTKMQTQPLWFLHGYQTCIQITLTKPEFYWKPTTSFGMCFGHHLQQRQALPVPLLHFLASPAFPSPPGEEGQGCKSLCLACCLPSQGSSVRGADPRAAPGQWWLMNALLRAAPLAVQPQILLIMLGVDKVRRSPQAGIYQASPEKCNFSWAEHFPVAPASPGPHKRTVCSHLLLSNNSHHQASKIIRTN